MTDTFQNQNLCEVSYADVIKACNKEHFDASVADSTEIEAIIKAVNVGIDGRLEACFLPDMGDKYEHDKRMVGELEIMPTLECCISPRSLAVLLRRLFEGVPGMTDEEHEAGASFATDILYSLGFDELGQLDKENTV